MIKAVLLDLDNTLLHNPDRQFAEAFRRAFAAHFSDCYGIERAAEALRPGIKQLNAERNTAKSNAEVILENLAGELSLPEEMVAAALSSFYQGPYQDLKSLSYPVPAAAALVESLLGQNLHVAIATNPLYPESAIRTRLEWAGLSDYFCDFAFITHSENMHFSKPDPAYFAETVARIGVEPDEALLLGDSDKNDIRPARVIGVHTLQVKNAAELNSILCKIQKDDWRSDYLGSEIKPAAIMPQYRGNIAALYGLLSEVKEHQWLQRPDPAEWSILQILCHLWKVETEVHQQRLRMILGEDDPFIASVTPPGPRIPHCHDDGYAVMSQFHQRRCQTMELIAGLTRQDWQRPARHSIFGLTNLLEMAYFTAQHDRLHITQLCQTLGKCAD